MMSAAEFCSLVFVMVIFLRSIDACEEGMINGHRGNAVARGFPRDMTYYQRGMTSQQTMGNELLDMLFPIIKDATSHAWDLIQIIGWPIGLAMGLHSTVLSQIGAFISWFNFFVSFIRPDGAGAALLAWLRGDPAKMSRDAPWPIHDLSSIKSRWSY